MSESEPSNQAMPFRQVKAMSQPKGSELRPAPMRNFCVAGSYSLPSRPLSGGVPDFVYR